MIRILLITCLLVGCQTPTVVDQSTVLGHLAATPNGSLVNDDEAARLALLNNAAFQEALADLGITRAQVIEANQFPNPTLSILFPLGPKQLEFAMKFPLEAIWLRPRRVEAAQLDATALSKTLTQNGLDLIRNVKFACADLRLAESRVSLTREQSALIDRIAAIADARVAAGDAAELEVAAVRADAATAREQIVRVARDTELAREKLRHLAGRSLKLTPQAIPPSLTRDPQQLLKQALASRPDLRGAEIVMEAEGKRIGVAKAQIFAITGVLDANGSGSDFEAGPGLEATLPIFHQNQGAIALADAKFRKATLHYATLRDQIETDVRQALILYHQAAEAYHMIGNESLPALQGTVAQAEKAYQAGDVAYLIILESTRKLHEARARQVQALADWHRAAAELERATGSALTALQK
jgi:outer membrane protein, heavy metal efflux system